MSALFTALVEGETKESLANMVCELRVSLRQARGGALEEAAQVAEEAIMAGEAVRDDMAALAPIPGLENALHAILVTTANGIARNIRTLANCPAPVSQGPPRSEAKPSEPPQIISES